MARVAKCPAASCQAVVPYRASSFVGKMRLEMNGYLLVMTCDNHFYKANMMTGSDSPSSFWSTGFFWSPHCNLTQPQMMIPKRSYPPKTGKHMRCGIYLIHRALQKDADVRFHFSFATIFFGFYEQSTSFFSGYWLLVVATYPVLPKRYGFRYARPTKGSPEELKVKHDRKRKGQAVRFTQGCWMGCWGLLGL